MASNESHAAGEIRMLITLTKVEGTSVNIIKISILTDSVSSPS